jgi:hypothetical protein
LAGSIPRVLPVLFLFTRDEVLSIAGGIAAAIAVGAFGGQAVAVLFSSSERSRRRQTAVGGLIGLLTIIGLILLSENAS